MQSLCRASRSAGLAKQTQLTAPKNVRFMATGKQIKQRMVSVASIKKITKAMKMVSASKLRGVQQNLENSRKFAAGPAASWPVNDKAPAPQKVLFVPITSDRGLCGAVNSSIVRQLRPLIETAISEKKEIQVMPVGEKGRAIMERKYRDNFEAALSEIGKKKAPTFADASVAAELILNHKFDEFILYFNKFKNAISYSTTAIHVPSLANAMASGAPQFYGVNFGPHPLTSRLRILEDLYEFRIAALMYQSLCESATSEQSSRMNAMEASSKNADEMFNSLTLSYNKARQAKITGELMEIVGGTAALEDAA